MKKCLFFTTLLLTSCAAQSPAVKSNLIARQMIQALNPPSKPTKQGIQAITENLASTELEQESELLHFLYQK